RFVCAVRGSCPWHGGSPRGPVDQSTTGSLNLSRELFFPSWARVPAASIIATMPPAIRCTNLVKRYDGRPPVEAVRALDLQVEEGECFGLLGPNGAGKTTTIEIIEGLLEPTAGEVEVLGLRWGGPDDEALRQRIGISL